MAAISLTKKALLNDQRGKADIRARLSESKEPQQFTRAIDTAWRNIRENMLAIGEYLHLAKQNLEHGQFMQMVSQDLPFSYQVAHKLMAIHRAVTNGEVPGELLPAAYSTAYMVVSMEPEIRQAGIQENVITPKATYGQLARFVKERRAQRRQPSSRHRMVDPGPLVPVRRSRLPENRAEIVAALKAFSLEKRRVLESFRKTKSAQPRTIDAIAANDRALDHDDAA